MMPFATTLVTLASSIGLAQVAAQQIDPNLGTSGMTWDPINVGANKSTDATFSNPVITVNVGDPFMTRTFTATSDADNPPQLQDALRPINCPAINHRMFVLEGDEPDPWAADFRLKSQLNSYDQFAIDGTYFVYEDKLYHIYSCWENTYSSWPANLCLRSMSNPWTVSSNFSDRRMISVPDRPWEQIPNGRPIRLATNEGPQQLTNPKTGQSFVIYSAARVNTPFYCLGMLELVGNDPMEYQSWKKRTQGCVSHQNTKTGVSGTGHANFTTSPDGSEDYLVYHAQTAPNPAADLYRTTRIQKFTWNDDGTPNSPLAENGPSDVPAGQKALTFVNLPLVY
ncbi:hypothetical protein TruAng_002073 [Truncatella angustata]|nr:hypothetical protein TruAng_002073 [Truncatella angustata]